jgi:hypothetical protein
MLSRSAYNACLSSSSLAGLARSSVHFLQHLQHQLTSASRASAAAAAAPAQTTSQDSADTLEFPGGRVPFTHSMQFLGGPLTPSSPRIPCYRTLDGTGKHIPDAEVPHDLQQQDAVALYTAMARLQVMDTICYDAQRQVSAELDGQRLATALGFHHTGFRAAGLGSSLLSTANGMVKNKCLQRDR